MIFVIQKRKLSLVIQGREDDNIETIRKRFKVFLESSLPVVEYYESIGKVQKVNLTKIVSKLSALLKIYSL